jgi:DNA-binding response OmpR family regulator
MNILHIDDDPVETELLQLEFKEAHSAHELTSLNQIPPKDLPINQMKQNDIVILDWCMNPVSGQEIIGLLLDNHYTGTIVIFTDSEEIDTDIPLEEENIHLFNKHHPEELIHFIDTTRTNSKYHHVKHHQHR